MDKQVEDEDATKAPGNLPAALFGSEGVFTEFLKAVDPTRWIEQNMRFTQEMFRIMTGSSEVEPDPRDWRFQDGAWQKNPFYKRLAQSYLAMVDAIEGMIPEDLEPDQKARVELATEIVTTAFAPTNTLAGNPAALLRSIETQGQSTARGFRNLLDDWLNNGGMPSQVDASEFRVGKNLAMTPGKVVLKTEMFELIHYAPTEKEVYQVPTLLIPPQINRFYFTDLAPGRSFAEYAVSRGLNHFVVSWRNPQVEHSDWSLEDYAEAALEATEAVAAISGAEKVNLIAFCAGGILASLVAGFLAARGRDLVNTLALCVTMLDWEVDAQIGAFRFPTMLNVARAQAQMKGVLPGEDLGKVFTWLRPNDLVWNYWVNNYLMGESPAAFDILAWNNDSTNLSARLHADFLEIFKENPLVDAGRFEFLGEAIDLSKIDCDNYIVGAVTDHLTPWKACYRSCRLLGGESTFALSNGGHVAALVNPPDNPKAHHTVGPGTAPDADAWEETAKRKSGSWWLGWADWVSERSGEKVKAPKNLGSKKFAAIANAPGSYVLS